MVAGSIQKTLRIPEIDPTIKTLQDLVTYLNQLLRVVRNNFATVDLEISFDNNYLSFDRTATDYGINPSSKVVLCDTSVSGFNVQMPPASDLPNKFFIIKRVTSDANDLTILPDGAETIDLAANYVLSGGGLASVQLYSDGIGWWTI